MIAVVKLVRTCIVCVYAVGALDMRASFKYHGHVE